MPTLIEGCEISGVLKKTHASKWGLPHGVIIAGGGGDNAASAIGINLMQLVQFTHFAMRFLIHGIRWV